MGPAYRIRSASIQMILLAIILVVFGVAQGVLRGAARVLGLVVAMILAMVLCFPLGRLAEGAVAGVLGTSGLLARFASIVSMALIVTIVVSLAISIPARRWMKKHPEWKKWDRIAGAGLGLVEGLLLVLALLWIPQALEPIAKTQIEDAQQESRPAPPLAQRIADLATSVRSSPLGGVAAATNPVAGSELMNFAGDFSQISHDPEAIDAFMQTDVMKKVQAMPSVVQAIDMLEKDPQLNAIGRRGGLSVGMLREVLENPTVLKVFDETTIINDLAPMADDLRKAIQDVKSRSARTANPPVPRPPPKSR